MTKYKFNTPPERSSIMKKIKSKDTKVELLLRKELWKQGCRGYRKNSNKLIGKPDIVYSKYKLVVFVDGSFFHGLDMEKVSKLKTNRDYWIPKIQRNIQRDKEVNSVLSNQGWTVLRFSEKEVTHNLNQCIQVIKQHLCTL